MQSHVSAKLRLKLRLYWFHHSTVFTSDLTMSSQDNPGDAMDSQPEATTSVSEAPTLQPDPFDPSNLPVGIPIPLCSRDEFIDIMNKFYTKATAEQDGFRIEDAFYVMNVARSARHRTPRHEGFCFVDHPARQDIVIRFYRRLNVELQERIISTEKYQLLSSALCWAFLHVPDDAVMVNITILLAATAMHVSRD